MLLCFLSMKQTVSSVSDMLTYTVILEDKEHTKCVVLEEVKINKLADLCDAVYGQLGISKGMYITRYFLKRDKYPKQTDNITDC